NVRTVLTTLERISGDKIACEAFGGCTVAEAYVSERKTLAKVKSGNLVEFRQRRRGFDSLAKRLIGTLCVAFDERDHAFCGGEPYAKIFARLWNFGEKRLLRGNDFFGGRNSSGLETACFHRSALQLHGDGIG